VTDSQPKRKYATNSKLSKEEVLQIHKEYKNYDHDEFELAQLYGVSVSTIYNIVRGRSWKWLGLEPVYRRKPEDKE